jgi:hypothetical protein
MTNFKSLTGGFAAAALVSVLGLAYAQPTGTDTPSGTTSGATQYQSQSGQTGQTGQADRTGQVSPSDQAGQGYANQPSAAERGSMTGTSQSRDSSTSSTLPSDNRLDNRSDSRSDNRWDSRSGSAFDGNVQRAPRADRN